MISKLILIFILTITFSFANTANTQCTLSDSVLLNFTSQLLKTPDDSDSDFDFVSGDFLALGGISTYDYPFESKIQIVRFNIDKNIVINDSINRLYLANPPPQNS